MARSLVLLSFALLIPLALAAPVPRPKEGAFEKGWDRPLDPDKDCKLTLGASSLAIEVPGKPHLLHRGGPWPLLNAPRLLRDVEGDFVAEVRVTSDWAVSLLSSDPRREAQVRAGLVFLPARARGEEDHYSLQYGARRDGKAPVRFTYAELGDTSLLTPQTAEPRLPPEGARSALLRLERRGKAVRGWVSADGKAWLKQGFDDLELPDSLPERGKVGLVACSTSTARFRVTFDRFKLTPLKAEAKAKAEVKPEVKPEKKTEKK